MNPSIQKISLLFLLLSCLAGCREKEIAPAPSPSPDTAQKETARASASQDLSPGQPPPYFPQRTYKVVHIFVALCDNRHQGIVPVPAAIGNGQDPQNNLYWGAMYGVKTYFRKQAEWKSIDCSPVQTKTEITDCAAFKRKDVYVVAQAYDGACMQTVLNDFFLAAAGKYTCDFRFSESHSPHTIQAGSMADLICFVGHNGLMDIRVSCPPAAKGVHQPDWAVVLACKSDPYFSPLLKNLNCKPLITTSGFMAPEAYTLEAILQSWSDKGDILAIRNSAAAAYSRYQKCSINAAKNLFIPYTETE